MNLIMCDKKCKYQTEGYCSADGKHITAQSGDCLYFEAPEQPKPLRIECPEHKPVEEIPVIQPDLYVTERLPDVGNA